MDTRALTNGRDRAKGWTQDEAGNWTPSLHDRRRAAVAELNAVAEANGGVVHGPVMVATMLKHSTSKGDFEEMVSNFNEWMAKNAQ